MSSGTSGKLQSSFLKTEAFAKQAIKSYVIDPTHINESIKIDLGQSIRIQIVCVWWALM